MRNQKIFVDTSEKLYIVTSALLPLTIFSILFINNIFHLYQGTDLQAILCILFIILFVCPLLIIRGISLATISKKPISSILIYHAQFLQEISYLKGNIKGYENPALWKKVCAVSPYFLIIYFLLSVLLMF